MERKKDIVNISGRPAQFYPVAHVRRNVDIDGRRCDILTYTNGKELKVPIGMYRPYEPQNP